MSESSNKYIESIKTYFTSKSEQYRPWWEPKYNKIAEKSKEFHTKLESEFNKIVEKHHAPLSQWIPKQIIDYISQVVITAKVISVGWIVYKIYNTVRDYINPPRLVPALAPQT